MKKLALFVLFVVVLAVLIVAVNRADGQSLPPVSVPPANVQPYLVRSGDTSFNAIGERLCGPANRTVVGGQIQRMNPSAGTLTVDEALEVPATCPAPPTTTSTSSTTTTGVTPSPTTVPTTLPATTTTVAPTTTTTSTTAPVSTAPTTTLPPATTTTTVPEPSSGFLASFDTADDFYDRFQLDVHFRDVAGDSGDHVQWNEPISGDHDMGCGGPTTQRTIHAHREVDGTDGADLRNSELFWFCAPGNDPAKGHMMTGMGDIDGYTILSFAPDRPFINPTRVCWDQNLTNLLGRKWTQVLLIPEATYQANGRVINYTTPGSEEIDRTALTMPAGSFAWQLNDYMNAFYNVWQRPFNWSTDFNRDGWRFNTNDKAKRYQHCLTDNGNGTVTVVQERDGGSRTATMPGRFPDHARVIFQDDNYTPDKDGAPQGYTWHWDNIVVDVG